MKFVKILIMLSLILVTLQRITKKTGKNLKYSALKSMASADALGKAYMGSIIIDSGNPTENILRANELRLFEKGMPFRTNKNDVITDPAILSLLISRTKGIYYLPYRSMTPVQGESPFLMKDNFSTISKGKKFKFYFVYNSFDNAPLASLVQKINQFRSKRIYFLKDQMTSLSDFATAYSEAKTQFDNANSSAANADASIAKAIKDIADAQTKRAEDLKFANTFASQIITAENDLTAARKGKNDLNAINTQKNDLIEQLKASNADINKQKAANTIDSASFKKDMDQNSKDFLTIIATLKIEVFGADSIKVDSSKSALIEKSDLKECTAQINSILP